MKPKAYAPSDPRRDKRPKPDKPKPEKPKDGLAESVCALVEVLRETLEQKKTEFDWLKSRRGLVTKCDLQETERTIMSVISEFAAKQKAFNDRQDAAVSGLTADVAELNRKIEELQNTPGEITPEDQALLNDIEARSDAITSKLEALDALTPPAVPTP